MPQRKASAASFFPSLSRQEEGDAMRARAGPTIGSGGWKLPRQLQHVQPSSRPLRPGVSALGSTSIHRYRMWFATGRKTEAAMLVTRGLVWLVSRIDLESERCLGRGGTGWRSTPLKQAPPDPVTQRLNSQWLPPHQSSGPSPFRPQFGSSGGASLSRTDGRSRRRDEDAAYCQGVGQGQGHQNPGRD
jgi:hypothetical protein